eukprot:jgi/Astpho2/4389/Aster-x0632
MSRNIVLSTGLTDGNHGAGQSLEGLVSTDSTSKRGWFGGLTGKRGSISSAAAAEEIARQDPEYFRTQFYKQELDIRNLQQEIRARDDDVERMQQQWNLQNFKYQLLIDMWAMRVLDNEQLASNA